MAEVRDSKGLVHILLDEENGYTSVIDLAYDIDRFSSRVNLGKTLRPLECMRSQRRLRSGAGRALSRTVVVANLRRLTPARPSARMRRATRLRPTWMPSGASSA
jgi:hypothetical protein